MAIRKYGPVISFIRALRRILGLPGAAVRLRVYNISPSTADASVAKFDDRHLVIFDKRTTAAAPLVVFLPGTGGKPKNARDLLRVAARRGYRAIGLKYNDTPAVDQVCPGDLDPDCSGEFRRMRVYGEGKSRHVHNPPAESIANRLASLLAELARRHPEEGWGAYRLGEEPNWPRMVVSGLSQGAGMAAYIAKTREVARVVLFSGPQDVAGPERVPAPWLSMPSATPPSRWFAAYNRRENAAATLAKAYAALEVPGDHIEVFDLDLPESSGGKTKSNPYHAVSIRDKRYAPKWRTLLGRAEPRPEA